MLRAADHLDDAGLADMVAGEFDAISGSQLWVDLVHTGRQVAANTGGARNTSMS